MAELESTVEKNCYRGYAKSESLWTYCQDLRIEKKFETVFS